MFKKCPYCGKLIIIGSHNHNESASNGNRKGRGGCGDGRSICA
jgi:hypothetical protein